MAADSTLSRTFRWQVDGFSKVAERKLNSRPTFLVNDRLEFPEELDLDRGSCKYLSPLSDRSVRNLYLLHSVVVHTGNAVDGHYHALICLDLARQWFKFDNEQVTKVEQCGGDEEYSNAYILTYIRQSDRDKILSSVDEKDIAQHVRTRWKLEQEAQEQKRKENTETDLFTVKVSRDEDMRGQIGRTVYFDLVDQDRVKSFQVGQLTDSAGISGTKELCLFLEGTSSIPNSSKLALHDRAKDYILLFVKLYDPALRIIRCMGHQFVSLDNMPKDVQEWINKMCGFTANQDIQLFE
ncbi:unnamed protein product, partial [Closterium sp. Naga37s-1]